VAAWPTMKRSTREAYDCSVSFRPARSRDECGDSVTGGVLRQDAGHQFPGRRPGLRQHVHIRARRRRGAHPGRGALRAQDHREPDRAVANTPGPADGGDEWIRSIRLRVHSAGSRLHRGAGSGASHADAGARQEALLAGGGVRTAGSRTRYSGLPRPDHRRNTAPCSIGRERHGRRRSRWMSTTPSSRSDRRPSRR
jgi:hypothetical protein